MGCGRMIGPYECCSVVCCDCLEAMKQLPDGCVDAVITDPPYGISYSALHGGNGSKMWGNARVHGDDKPFDPRLWLTFAKVILWGGNHYAHLLPSSGGWLLWDKNPFGAREGFVQSHFEIAWSNVISRAQRFSWEWNGASRHGEGFLHPTQKPAALMEWCVELSDAHTILDPFCGSGTTLVAAKKLGRHYLGFEISPEYVEISRKRIALVEAQPNLFEKKPEQGEMF